MNAYGESDSSGLSFVALDPHKKGGPMRRWFYFLAQGVERLKAFFPGSTWQRRGSPYLPGGLQGIGIGRALRVHYKTITEMLLPGEEPTYGDLRDAMDLTVMLESFEATGDVCTRERMAVRDAWAPVGQAPHGAYEFWVHYYSRCDDSTSQSYHTHRHPAR